MTKKSLWHTTASRRQRLRPPRSERSLHWALQFSRGKYRPSFPSPLHGKIFELVVKGDIDFDKKYACISLGLSIWARIAGVLEVVWEYIVDFEHQSICSRAGVVKVLSDIDRSAVRTDCVTPLMPWPLIWRTVIRLSNYSFTVNFKRIRVSLIVGLRTRTFQRVQSYETSFILHNQICLVDAKVLFG